MSKLVIAGTGYVGLVAGVCFAKVGHDVICVDVDGQKVAALAAGIPPIYEAELAEYLRDGLSSHRLRFTTDDAEAYADAEVIFIAVGTPEQKDGAADLSGIAAVSRRIAASVRHDCLVVVKSTVPVGTNAKVEQAIRDHLANGIHIWVASNPEFLAQGSAIRDMMHASRIVIGTEEPEAERLLREIYAPFGQPIVAVSRRSAEMIKYACNDFLALKISYINDIANLCELVGADIGEVAEGMRYDPRIGEKHLVAGVGYGGSCFPKDTKALRYMAEQYGYKLRTVDAAVAVNAAQKTRLFEKAKNRFISFAGVRVAFLGVAFKAGTDDLREAPALDNAERLLAEGAALTFYDPAAAARFQARFPDAVCAESPLQALEGADCCFVFTEWSDIAALEPEVFLQHMKLPLVYDGRNLYDPGRMKRAGVAYHSVGRASV